MSIELVRRAAELASTDRQAGDEELLAIFAPYVVLDFRARVFNPAVYEGHDGLRQFYADSRDVWEALDVTVREIVEEGDRYLVIWDARSRARGSGIEVAASASGIWTAADGRLKHFRLLSPAEADRAAGLAALRDQAEG